MLRLDLVSHKACSLDQSFSYFTLMTYQIISPQTCTSLQMTISYHQLTPLKSTKFPIILINSAYGQRTGPWTSNITKCYLMTKKNETTYHPIPNVLTVKSTKNLDVTVDYRLNWSDHINNVTAKACKTLVMAKHTLNH